MRNEKAVVQELVARDMANKNLEDDSHVKWLTVLNVVKWFKVLKTCGKICAPMVHCSFFSISVIMQNLDSCGINALNIIFWIEQRHVAVRTKIFQRKKKNVKTNSVSAL